MGPPGHPPGSGPTRGVSASQGSPPPTGVVGAHYADDDARGFQLVRGHSRGGRGIARPSPSRRTTPETPGSAPPKTSTLKTQMQSAPPPGPKGGPQKVNTARAPGQGPGAHLLIAGKAVVTKTITVEGGVLAGPGLEETDREIRVFASLPEGSSLKSAHLAHRIGTSVLATLALSLPSPNAGGSAVTTTPGAPKSGDGIPESGAAMTKAAGSLSTRRCRISMAGGIASVPPADDTAGSAPYNHGTRVPIMATVSADAAEAIVAAAKSSGGTITYLAAGENGTAPVAYSLALDGSGTMRASPQTFNVFRRPGYSGYLTAELARLAAEAVGLKVVAISPAQKTGFTLPPPAPTSGLLPPAAPLTGKVDGDGFLCSAYGVIMQSASSTLTPAAGGLGPVWGQVVIKSAPPPPGKAPEATAKPAADLHVLIQRQTDPHHGAAKGPRAPPPPFREVMAQHEKDVAKRAEAERTAKASADEQKAFTRQAAAAAAVISETRRAWASQTSAAKAPPEAEGVSDGPRGMDLDGPAQAQTSVPVVTVRDLIAQFADCPGGLTGPSHSLAHPAAHSVVSSLVGQDEAKEIALSPAAKEILSAKGDLGGLLVRRATLDEVAHSLISGARADPATGGYYGPTPTPEAIAEAKANAARCGLEIEGCRARLALLAAEGTGDKAGLGEALSHFASLAIGKNRKDRVAASDDPNGNTKFDTIDAATRDSINSLPLSEKLAFCGDFEALRARATAIRQQLEAEVRAKAAKQLAARQEAEAARCAAEEAKRAKAAEAVKAKDEAAAAAKAAAVAKATAEAKVVAEAAAARTQAASALGSEAAALAAAAAARREEREREEAIAAAAAAAAEEASRVTLEKLGGDLLQEAAGGPITLAAAEALALKWAASSGRPFKRNTQRGHDGGPFSTSAPPPAVHEALLLLSTLELNNEALTQLIHARLKSASRNDDLVKANKLLASYPADLLSAQAKEETYVKLSSSAEGKTGTALEEAQAETQKAYAAMLSDPVQAVQARAAEARLVAASCPAELAGCNRAAAFLLALAADPVGGSTSPAAHKVVVDAASSFIVKATSAVADTPGYPPTLRNKIEGSSQKIFQDALAKLENLPPTRIVDLLGDATAMESWVEACVDELTTALSDDLFASLQSKGGATKRKAGDSGSALDDRAGVQDVDRMETGSAAVDTAAGANGGAEAAGAGTQ